MVRSKLNAEKVAAVGLPPRPFLYTLDQVSTLLQIDLSALTTSWVHFNGRTAGIHRKDKLLAVDIAPVGHEPEWRVHESELIRWLRNRGIRLYERFLTA